MGDNVFQPRVDTVAVGGTVTWTNNGALPHTSTSMTDPPAWDSGTVDPGETFSRQFAQAGSFPYECTFHNGMTGTIVAC